MMGAVREGNWMDAAAGPAKMATAMAGIVPIAKGAKAIRAYHGSPHNFDKFDITKIGTGEGGQAFGHGLYFAGNEDVAKSYRNLSPTVGTASPRRTFLGEEVQPGTPQYHAGTLLSSPGRTLPNVRKEVQGWIANARPGEDTAHYQGVLEALSRAQGKRDFGLLPAGHMYEVGIHADPKSMLNLDQSVAKQPASFAELVRDSLKGQGYLSPKDNGPRQLESALRAWKMERGGMADTPMDALVTGSRSLLGPTPEAISKTLLDAGIPGSRYLDQGSRNVGRGTSNYVMFDDKTIEILRKYGLLPATVAAGVGGAAALPSNDIPPGGLF
jgi:hypothetical protein